MRNKTNLIGYPIVAIIAALITYFCTRGPGPVIPTEPTQPEEIISFKDAVQLYRTYTVNRSCIIKTFEGGRDGVLDSICPSDRKPDPKFVPSRSFHLSDTFLNQYIAYIKDITPDSIAVTGYRLYLGNYPDAPAFPDGKPIPDPRRNTFFIAPTTLLGGGDVHRGYTFFDRNNDGKPEVVFLEDILDELGSGDLGTLNEKVHPKVNTANFFSFLTTAQEHQSTIANEVGGYPPN
ncbi:hypothetical protein [Aquimarina sp. AU474]|uniref:hypothetical protein n=1 Tax=Aquimarina sp. AU474 TaxID=2108529 RepID=UPI000D687F0D|nr:hypothetical protein [Aquimarina sp. AU474]